MKNVQSKQKVKILCPHGHELFPLGISLVNLYKSYAVRVDESQELSGGMDWDAVFKKMFAMVEKMGGTMDRADFDKGKNKDAYLCPVYQVAQGQMKLLPACKQCEK